MNNQKFRLIKGIAAALALSALGAQAKTTTDYVQDGLVACWDGYENVGSLQHAAFTNVWRDLVGGIEISLPDCVTIEDRSMLSAADTSKTSVTLASIPGADDAAAVTVEQVIQRVEWTYTDNYNNLQSVFGMPRGSIGYRQNKSNGFYYYGPSSSTKNSLQNWVHATALASDLHTVSGVFGSNKATDAIYMDGVKDAVSFNASYTADRGTQYSFFGNLRAKMRVCSIRVYNRVLTDSEIAANRAIDVERFVEGDVYPEVDIFVCGEPQNYVSSGSPAYGVFDRSGDEVELTAPEYVELSASERAYCTGWKLYDRVTRELIAESTGATRLVCAFTYTKPVRLAWQWETRYLVSVSAEAGLGVSPTSAWGSETTPAVFTVSGTDCPFWTGDGIDDRFAKTVSVAADGPLMISVAAGTAIAVPTDVATVEAALAAAQPGDVITLAAGVYMNASYDGIFVPADVTLRGGGATPADCVIKAYSASANDATSASLVSVTGRLENITFTGARCNSDSTVPRVLVATDGALVTNCVFTGHTTTAKGYLVLVTGEGTRVVDTTISDAAFSGGNGWTSGTAVKIADNAVVSASTIDNIDMRVDPTSAAVLLTGGGQLLKSTVKNCDVYTREVFRGRAGGVCVNGATCLVEDCVIENNTISTDVAAGKVYQGAGGLSVCAAATVRRTIVRNNTSGNAYAGGVWVSAAATLENCLIAGNRVTAPINNANSVGGLCVANAAAVLKHVTVVGNDLLSVGTNVKAHGAYLNGARAVNSIFWGNGPVATAASSMNLAVAGTKGCVTYSLASSAEECVNDSNATSGTGCVTGDPLFTNAADCDYTIGSLSPAVDTGDADDGVADDLRGIARPKNFGFDMGCYECEYTAAYECSIAPILQYVGLKGGTVTFSGNATMSKAVDRMVWTVTAQSGAAPEGGEGLSREITFPAGENVYTVSLKTYWNGGQEAVAEESATVRVTEGVALAPGGDLVAMLGTMQNIPADNPVTVALAEGLYTAENSGVMTDDGWMFVVPSGVILRGAGEGRTVLDGGAARRVLRVLTGGTAAELSITNALSNGTASSGYFADVSGGTLRNVTVDGCCAKCSTVGGQHAVYLSQGGLITGCTIKDIWNIPPNAYSSNGGILTVAGGTVTNTIVSGNRYADVSYGTVTLSGSTALMTDSLVCTNRALNKEYRYYGAGGVALKDGAVLRNSRIIGNLTQDSYGYIYSGGVIAEASTVENCRIEENTATRRRDSDSVSAGIILYKRSVCRNCLVANNVLSSASPLGAEVAAGVCMKNYVQSNVHYVPTLINCTVVGNTVNGSTEPQAGLVLGGGTVCNSIIWGNVGITNGVSEVANMAATTNDFRIVSYTCTTPLIDGVGNIASDPLFRMKSNDGFSPYNLRQSSPCIDVGDPSIWGADDIDLEGNPRMRNGHVHMGCFETVVRGLLILFR